MRVAIKYRHYKPLHDVFKSYVDYPPSGIDYVFPKPKKYLKKLFPIYSKYGDNKIVSKSIKLIQNKAFTSNDAPEADLIEFIQIVPASNPKKPYIVDIEHFSGLLNFVKPDNESIRRVTNFLEDDKCKNIICLSEAAKENLKMYFDKTNKKIMNKSIVIYPSSPNNYKIYKGSEDYSYFYGRNKLKLLFVGNDVYRKGLHEIIEAIKNLGSKSNDISLVAVSDADDEFQSKYNYRFVKYLKPQFSKEEIVKKLYIPADVFLFPTHGDTFGMAVLDALSCGTPVIATKQFALPEMVVDGYNGWLINSQKQYLKDYPLPDKTSNNKYPFSVAEKQLSNQLSRIIKDLVDNRSLISRYSINAVNDFNEKGKFSVNSRNRALLKVYESALNI